MRCGQAAQSFQQVIATRPDDVDAYYNLGTLYLRRNSLQEAQQYLEQTVKLRPNYPEAWNNLGMIAGQQENYDEALRNFLAAARANPNNSLAVENMMRVYRFQGRAADAQKSLEELIAKAPENANLHLALGMALVTWARFFYRWVRHRRRSAGLRSADGSLRILTGLLSTPQ